MKHLKPKLLAALFLAVPLLIGTWKPAPAQTTCDVIELGPLPDLQTDMIPFRLNNRGEVVGTAFGGVRGTYSFSLERQRP